MTFPMARTPRNRGIHLPSDYFTRIKAVTNRMNSKGREPRFTKATVKKAFICQLKIAFNYVVCNDECATLAIRKQSLNLLIINGYVSCTSATPWRVKPLVIRSFGHRCIQ
jgi:hypothetical protein